MKVPNIEMGLVWYESRRETFRGLEERVEGGLYLLFVNVAESGRYDEGIVDVCLETIGN